MRFRLSPIAVVFALQLILTAQIREEPPGFSLGRLVGHCLVAKCRVFKGSLLTDTPARGQPVKVRVEEEIFGPKDGQETIDIPYADPNEFVKSYDDIHIAWGIGGGVSFGQNAPVTAAVALEKIQGLAPGEPVLVTSNENISSVIRSLAAEAAQLETDGAHILQAFTSLSQKRDGALAGYLFEYLINRLAIVDPDLETSLLGQMIGNPSVPPHAWNDIVARLGLEYFRLSTSAREAVARRFVDLAQAEDVRAATAGFCGLAQIDHFHDEVRALIPPSVAGKLATAYRTLVEKRTLQRNRSLETLLGVPRR